ncbi:MAG: AAA family ATPase, partial [Candidatus Methylomirabilis sp.]|nr:AAA family ATPase [Deltaproteobacteria bacterium]
NNEEVAARADQWLAERAARETLSLLLPETGGWVETPTSAQIVETLEYAKISGDLVLVYGEPGTGKTITFRHYALSRRNVWCVTATPAHASVTGFLASVATAVGVRGVRYQRARLHDEVVARIKGTQGLVIVDEAQFLTRQALEEARAIYDACGETVGLCLGGDARLHASVHGEDFAQLSSRVGAPLFIPGPRESDAEKIVEALKIGDGRARKFLLDVASRGEAGGIRMLVKAARLAGRKAAGRPVQLHHIQEAHAALAGGEA